MYTLRDLIPKIYCAILLFLFVPVSASSQENTTFIHHAKRSNLRVQSSHVDDSICILSIAAQLKGALRHTNNNERFLVEQALRSKDYVVTFLPNNSSKVFLHTLSKSNSFYTLSTQKHDRRLYTHGRDGVVINETQLESKYDFLKGSTNSFYAFTWDPGISTLHLLDYTKEGKPTFKEFDLSEYYKEGLSHSGQIVQVGESLLGVLNISSKQYKPNNSYGFTQSTLFCIKKDSIILLDSPFEKSRKIRIQSVHRSDSTFVLLCKTNESNALLVSRFEEDTLSVASKIEQSYLWSITYHFQDNTFCFLSKGLRKNQYQVSFIKTDDSGTILQIDSLSLLKECAATDFYVSKEFGDMVFGNTTDMRDVFISSQTLKEEEIYLPEMFRNVYFQVEKNTNSLVLKFLEDEIQVDNIKLVLQSENLKSTIVPNCKGDKILVDIEHLKKGNYKIIISEDIGKENTLIAKFRFNIE